MFEDLLPAVEKGIIDATGSIPVVFKGIERNLQKGLVSEAPSRHDYHELTYIRSGKAEFEVEGKRVLLEKGATIVIRPNTSHLVRVPEGQADVIGLYFGFTRQITGSQSGSQPQRTTDIAPQTLEYFINFAYGRDLPEGEIGKDPFILIRGKNRQDIATLIERIIRESRQDAYGRELMMQLMTMEILVAVARGIREEWEESLRVRTGKARELVRIARDFIVENHDRDITVADAAGYVFLSQGYFTRAFRDETGMSPMSFLMQVRVAHACKLLEQRDIKVSGVALQVGFSSPQRFNAAFRKHMGKTPMEYRKQILEMKEGK
ncbi:MAG: AraC family transcriptional regulator [Saccharofermentanales bacterium]|nr:AraC family transcriptional regulator [Clostridiaceae bacterium]